MRDRDLRGEVKYWAGLAAAALGVLAGLAVVPVPYDKLVVAAAAVAGAVASYQITPGRARR